MKEKINFIMNLKGVFCMIIVLFHTWDIEAIGEYIIFPYIKNYGGFMGNYFFFIVSGILISYNYKEKIRDNNIGFKTYILKRMVRLYPLYFITNICSLIRIIVVYGIETIKVGECFWIFTMLAGGCLKNINPYNSVCWFACVLVFCYILYFFIRYISKNEKIYYLAIAGCIVWGIIILNQEWNLPYSYVHTGEALTNFFLGCLLYEIILVVNTQYKRQIITVLILMITLWGVCTLIFNTGLDVRIIISFVICPTVIITFYKNSFLENILNNPCLKYLGKISTSIYFWHLFISKIFFPIFNYQGMFKDIVEYLVYLLVLILWSSISYQIIEKRLVDYLQIQLKKRVFYE